MEDNYLNRRAAFWDNWRSYLEHAIKQFEADSSGKFIVSDDKPALLTVKTMLNSAYISALKRYHTVLGEQINAIDTEGKNVQE